MLGGFLQREDWERLKDFRATRCEEGDADAFQGSFQADFFDARDSRNR